MLMGTIDEYWNEQAKQLRSQFTRMRRAHVDSDVKGTGNEQIVAELIQDNLAHRTIVTNCSIIDAQGRRSGEIDIAICNEYQPFLARPSRNLTN